MKEELEKKESNIVVPFLVGGLVGAGIALLLAPKSGKELRNDIRDVTASTRNKIISSVEKGKELYADSTSAVKGAIEAGKAAYREEMERHRTAA